MELVINIPEETYNQIIKKPIDWRDLNPSAFYNAIKNGTPLPKGHGRLIDGDKFEKSCTLIDDWPGNTKRVLNILAEVPTIIEADKAENEGEN